MNPAVAAEGPCGASRWLKLNEEEVRRDARLDGFYGVGLGELDDIVLHPPIQRFLARWRPGDPIVYLGPLWAP